MKSNPPGWLQVSRTAAFLFCAALAAAFAPSRARASCVTATDGSTWLNTALSAVQTHSFTAYYDATPSAFPINAFVGLSKGAQTAYTGFATLVRFSPTGQIDARKGGAFAAASIIPYSAGLTYHFRVAVNVAARTYSIYVTPPGGSELTVGLNYAFRTEQDKVTQLDHWGVHADPTNTGSLTVCNFSIGVPKAPVFSPAAGTYTGVQSVTITTTDDTAIYYTTNGATPTAASTLYSGAVTLPLGTTTLKAIAVNANGSSAVTTGVYVLTPPAPPTPVFSPAGGTFTSAQSVTIASAGATAIYYTTNGTAPTTSSTHYTVPVAIANNTVLKAIGVNSGGTSPVGTASFTILPPPPVFNPVPGAYTNVTAPFSVTISDAASAPIYYTTDGTTPTVASTQYTAPVSLPIGTTTLSAIAVNGNGFSAVTAGTYILTPPPPQTPVFSPAGGTFTGVQTVTIASAGANVIYYTTDGTTPTTSSTFYTGSVTISNNTTLQAIGVNAGGNSPVGTASFTLLPPLTSVFSPPGGTFTSVQTVTITSAGATAIYYTTDGSTPTTASTLYIGSVTVSSNTVLQALGVNAGGSSPVASAGFTILASAPVFSPAPGSYASAQSVTITTATSGATIHYTTDGSTPTETSGSIYSGPVSISHSIVLKAIAYESGLADSPVMSGLYTINSSPATILNVLYDFNSSNNGGINPPAALVQGSDGSFYGTTYHGGNGNDGTAFKITSAGAFTSLVSLNGTNGINPNASLVQGSDGNFYGTALDGGSNLDGTVFRMTPTGTLTPLISFNGTNGEAPLAALVQGSDGNFYSTTYYGGSSNDGTIFKMTPGGVLSTLASFNGSNGESPTSLMQGSDGNFYGTTYGSSAGTYGTVFKVTPAGTLTSLVTFNGTNGSNPEAPLVQGSDGNFYGTTAQGGSSNDGTVFKMTPTGVLTTLVSFTGTNGAGPEAGLVQGSDGNFYGTTIAGGSSNYGTVFEMTPAGALTTLVSFDGANGANSAASLVQGSDGNFYGTTVSGGIFNQGAIFQLIVPPQAAAPVFSPAPGTYSSAQSVTITSATPDAFISYTTDGSTPTGIHGTLYSGPVSISSATTLNAIAYAPGFLDSPVTSGIYLFVPPPLAPAFSPPGGTYIGTQYVTITSVGATAIYYTTDGATPAILSPDSMLYTSAQPVPTNMVLKAIGVNSGGISPIGTASYTILPPATAPVFSPGPGAYANAQAVTITTSTNGATIHYTTDGSTPTETNGSIYSGPVSIGGSTMLKAITYETGFADSPVTSGLYTISSSPAVILNVMYDFSTFSNNVGGDPYAGLVQASDGNFYGTTVFGDGTVFKITPMGVATGLVSLYGPNGAGPFAGLVQGSDGNFYGTTSYGGSILHQGTVFKMTPAGAVVTLYSFSGADGKSPEAALVQGSDGNFYGTTGGGGNLVGDGTVFKITPTGILTHLVSFDRATTGSLPMGALVQGNDGNFYGITEVGGPGGYGTVFKMTPAGVLTTLVSFDGTNGADPQAALVQGSDGNFYGTTDPAAGGSTNPGTIFKMTPSGVLTTLVSFNTVNGAQPVAALMQGRDGNFYGTTDAGGSVNYGTVFKMTPDGVLTTLASFDYANGANPTAALVQGTDGNFYGTTVNGGIFSYGVVFQLIVPPTTPAPAQ